MTSPAWEQYEPDEEPEEWRGAWVEGRWTLGVLLVLLLAVALLIWGG